MLLAQLEGFLEVAKRGSVSRAAEALFITQPTLTARLHALEQELGERLFVRTRHGMRLTDSGRAFITYAERATQAVREGRRALSGVRNASAGHLVIASAPAISTYLLPPILERFALRHPKVEIAVRTGHSEDVLQMVLRDEVQVGLGRALNHPEVRIDPFSEDELMLVAAPDHRITRLDNVTLADMAGERLVFFDRTSSYYELTNAAFVSAGVSPRSVMELDNIEAAKKMVERRLGLAFLPRVAVAAEMMAGNLVEVKVGGLPVLKRRLVAMRRRDAGEPAGVVGAFMDLLRPAGD